MELLGHGVGYIAPQVQQLPEVTERICREEIA